MLAGANAVRYTVEGLFESVRQAARRSDVVEVAYDPQYGYPAMIRPCDRSRITIRHQV